MSNWIRVKNKLVDLEKIVFIDEQMYEIIFYECYSIGEDHACTSVDFETKEERNLIYNQISEYLKPKEFI
jgi:hypothetical protein